MDASPQHRPTLAQHLLGLFVIWQFGFLCASNIFAFFPHGDPEEGELSDSRTGPARGAESGPVQNSIDAANFVLERWEHLTGQIQAWWLFAPGFPPQATFPVVELRWDDPDTAIRSNSVEPTHPPVRLHSLLEPQNTKSYARLPGSFDRLFHYEIRFGLLMTLWDDKPKDATVYGIWEDAIRDRVQRQWRSMRAYLRWRVRAFQEEHPDRPMPTQAILIIRIYPTPAPGATIRPAPIEKALARWQPAADGTGDFLPIEMCAPRSDKFVRLPRKVGL
jgi:hypothetical protein